MKAENIKIGQALLHDIKGKIFVAGIHPHCGDYAIILEDNTWVYLKNCSELKLDYIKVLDIHNDFISEYGLWDSFLSYVKELGYTEEDYDRVIEETLPPISPSPD